MYLNLGVIPCLRYLQPCSHSGLKVLRSRYSHGTCNLTCSCSPVATHRPTWLSRFQNLAQHTVVIAMLAWVVVFFDLATATSRDELHAELVHMTTNMSTSRCWKKPRYALILMFICQMRIIRRIMIILILPLLLISFPIFLFSFLLLFVLLFLVLFLFLVV